MFKPVKEVCPIHYIPMAASITITKGDALWDNGAGYLTNASPTAVTEVLFVAAETITTASATYTPIGCYSGFQTEFEADTDNAPAQTDIFTKCDLATAATVNPDASSNDVFLITQIMWAVANKKVRGRFVQKIA